MPENLKQSAIAAAVALAVYKFAPNAAVKSAAVGVLGVIVAKNVPFIKDAI
jgi:hypothetical protein